MCQANPPSGCTIWYVYILRCADGTLYTGITTDVKRRVREHNEQKTGSKYTKSKRPVVMVYTEKTHTRSRALKREAEIKRLSKQEKEDLTGTNRCVSIEPC